MRLSLALLLVSALPVAAQPPEAAPRAPWAFAHDLRVRKGGSPEVTSETPLVGIEVYRDAAGDALIALTSTGGLAVTSAAGKPADSRVRWLAAHDLKRDAKPQPLGVEAFTEASTGRLIYVSEAGSIAFAAAPAKPAEGEATFHHALTLQVRKATETRFGPGSKRVTVDCFRDGVTGAAVYATDAGIAATPAQKLAPGEVKAPVALYGLAVRVRKPGPAAATAPATTVFGVEVYSDPNSGGLIYVSETGSVAAAPASGEPAGGQGAVWRRGFTLSARAGGTSDFAAAKPVTVEVVADPNSGHTLYVSDSGAIAVLPKK